MRHFLSSYLQNFYTFLLSFKVIIKCLKEFGKLFFQFICSSVHYLFNFSDFKVLHIKPIINPCNVVITLLGICLYNMKWALHRSEFLLTSGGFLSNINV